MNLFSWEQLTPIELFEGIEFPWEALLRLLPYLKGLKLGKIEGVVAPGAHLIHPEQISIGFGAIVEPGAYIEGPCLIGSNVQIRHGAYIRGGVILGDGCIVGHATEVKHSILLPGAKAAHFNYVGDSILGRDVNLGAGAKLANTRFDHGEIIATWGGKRIPTGMVKLGALLGDRVQIGCNAVTNPGTIMGREAICFPGFTIGGEIFPATTLRESIS
jgi:NDP-sugar pyrophosphorylase family protein